MRPVKRGKSFFLPHSIFTIFFISGLFGASLLTSHEFTAPNRAHISRSTREVLPPLPVSAIVSPHAPRIAILVDDAGENMELMNDLARIRIPLTVSILPDSRHGRESALWARDHGMEVMVHLPMEPEDGQENDPGARALRSSMNRQQLVIRTAQFLANVPGAVGANNHMGSKLTRKREKMNIVLNVIANQGLYFIDSRTSHSSIGYDLARRKGIPAAERSVFLDNPGDPVGILNRVKELVEMARARGSAVGICHLKSETLTKLQLLDPAQYSDVSFVSASRIVTR